MNIHYLQHVAFEGLGSIAEWVQQRGHTVSATRFYTADPLPLPDAIDGLIVMGGPMSIHDEADYPWLVSEKRFIKAVIGAGKPVLGICLGGQLIANVLGAKVHKNPVKEIGWFPVEWRLEVLSAGLGESTPGMADTTEAFHWHGETFDLPAQSEWIASSAACPNQGFLYGGKVLGLQFHLEATLSGAAALIEHCGDELVAAPFIQTAEAILAKPDRFVAINLVMRKVLDQLFRA